MKRSPKEIAHELNQIDPRDGRPEPLDFDVTVEWRDADPEARPEGLTWDPPAEDSPARLSFDLWGSQRDALNAAEGDDYDLVAAIMGYGAGKSILGARWLLANALEYDGSRFLAMGQDFAKAKPTTFKTLFSQLPGERTGVVTAGHNGPENSPVVMGYNRQENRLTLVNDTEIILGSADRWGRYAGLEIGGAWLDEPAHYGDELFDLLEMLGGRLRGVDGPKVQLWTTTGAGYNACYDILEQREDRNGDPIRLDIEIVRASTLDNPYLTEADKDRFRRQYEGTGREEQALRGGFSAGTGLVYNHFDPDRHVIEQAEAVELADDTERLYAYDAGFRHARVVLEAAPAAENSDRLVILDEFYRHESHVSDAIAWLNGRPQGVIYSEHEPADIEKFNRAGWRAEKADKSLDAGIDEVRNRLREDPESGKPGLLISDRCTNLIAEFRQYKEEHVGTSQATDDALDSLRYLCMGAADPKPEPYFGTIEIPNASWGNVESSIPPSRGRRH